MTQPKGLDVENLDQFLEQAMQGDDEDIFMAPLQFHDPRPNNIIFYDTSKGPQREVLRISPEGITANPDIPVDEAADAVIRALGGSIQQMIERSFKYEIGVDSVNGEHCVVVIRDNGDGTTSMVATKTIKEKLE
jgi:hypothetical protein